MVGTYPPTRCGIATFTESLAGAWPAQSAAVDVLRVTRPDDGPVADARVVATWPQHESGSERRAAALASSYHAVVIQHEYGIFAGPDGDAVVEFAESVEVPSIVVFHTALASPSAHQRSVVERLAGTSHPVVLSRSARTQLAATTSLPAESVTVIPHGGHRPLQPRPIRSRGPTVLTWGLVGPGKGIEHGIAAIASLQRDLPDVRYVVAGPTHPKVREREGERYRDTLRALVRRLGLDDVVRFDESYRTTPELVSMVQRADLVLLPYDSREQVTSGVLVDALAAGTPVVATAFPHAVELLGDGAGIVVPHESPADIAAALRMALSRPATYSRLREAAERAGLALSWPLVARGYADLVARQLLAIEVA